MSLQNYAELKTAINDWTDDGSEASDFADTYIDLCEAMFNQEIRVRDMETSSALTLDASGEADVPADFLEMRRVADVSSPGRSLEYLTPDVMRDYFPILESGTPTSYTIEAGKIRVRPAGAVTIYYYQTIPALSDSQTTNWLLTKSPMLFLAGCEA